MRMWISPLAMIFRPAAPARGGGSLAVDGTAAVAAPRFDAEAVASDRLMRELASAALLVCGGIAVRVVVCNAPATVDFDEVRLLADSFGVRMEPIVRVGGGGFDFAVTGGEASDG
jgi:hypothetical protein